MNTIIITQQDIEQAGLSYSHTWNLIDELAYSLGFDYEYSDIEHILEPYMFDYESDFLSLTKTEEQCETMNSTLGISIDIRVSNHIGASFALSNPSEYMKALALYTEYLQDTHSDTISSVWNTAINKEEEDAYDYSYREYLYGNQSSNWIIYKMLQAYSDGSYSRYCYDSKAGTIELELDDESERDKDEILSTIRENSLAYHTREQARREQAREERLYREKMNLSQKEREVTKRNEILTTLLSN